MRNRDRSALQHRRGWTLVEVLLVSTLTGALAVMGAITIAMLMTADTRGAESLVHQTTIARLGIQFREDLHEAAELSIEGIDGGEQNRLVLRQADGSTISYQIEQSAVDRRIAGGTHDGLQERYRLPDGQSHFEYSAEEAIVSLVLDTRRQPLSEVAAGELPPPAMDRITIKALAGWALRHNSLEPASHTAE